jgi:imidazolonepropionase-like amidohydrolase
MSDRVIKDAAAAKAAMGSDPYSRGLRNRLPNRHLPNPEQVTFNTRRPTTRMGVTWVFRKAFYDAQRFANGGTPSGADTPDEPALHALNRIRSGEIPLRIQARTHHDILAAIRLAGEFDLPFVLEEATEAYRCLDELKTHKVPVVFGPIYVTAPGYRARTFETERSRLHTLKALLDAGIETALTAQELREEDGLARQVMYAMRNGLTLEQVMPTVTSAPAKLLGLEDRLGTVSPGKQADLVLWNGKPFAATSSPAVVLIRGEVVVDRRKG